VSGSCQNPHSVRVPGHGLQVVLDPELHHGRSVTDCAKVPVHVLGEVVAAVAELA
jgi:hypothetical protein